MANPEHLKLLSDGSDYRQLDLSGATIYGRDFRGKDFTGSNLDSARLFGVNLSGATLNRVSMLNSQLCEINLSNADLSGARIKYANLSGADLTDANLVECYLCATNLDGANLARANFSSTVIADIDLREVKNINMVEHLGPSHVSTGTLARSQGAIPDIFLQGCGLQEWEVLQAKLYNPTLTPSEISELQYKIFDKRTHGPLFIGGVFISYSRTNDQFVDGIYARLKQAGVPVWLDRHDIIAGPLQEQIANGIRINDAVLLVLSEASIESDWVENELEMANSREKRENRNLLCPVALDNSWQTKLAENAPGRVLWRKLKEKAILDFSPSADFEVQFSKLLRGLKIHYEPKPK